MVELNAAERDLLERGGAIWCIRQRGKRWEVLKLYWQSEEVLYLSSGTFHDACFWVNWMIDTLHSELPTGLHHSIPREPITAPTL